MERKFITVTELCGYIKNIFLSEELLHNISVAGEISGFRISGNHAYFTLKDSGGAVMCSCFNYRKTYVPKEGEKVVLVGTPDFYPPSGRLSLIVSKIEAAGIGEIYRRIEALRLKLAAEGLFDEAHKIPVPKFCKNVIVVTSKSGAVIRDIYRTVKRKNPVINIVVKDVKVQGEFAVNEIASALAAVDALGYDCVILARGGGSLEDLLPFYDEKVVRAVYNMKTPIISAVGHETDVSLCDFAADARAATPTAAGELVAYDYYQTKRSVFDFVNRCKSAVSSNFTNALNNTRFLTSAVVGGVDRLYNANLAKIRLADVKIGNSLNNIIRQREFAVDKLINSLDRLNPTVILKSGYFKVFKDGADIGGVGYLKKGDTVSVRGADGRFDAEVIDVIKEEL